jgi:hypothetical protein
MAGSVIGALRVNLGLDSARFERGARQASASLNRMRGQFLAVAGVASTVGVALTGLTIATSRTAAEIGRFSQIANAAPGEFQAWAAGASSVGIAQEKLADILKDVNDRVGDFLTTGGGPMADFFENIAPQIGLTADAFRGLSGPQALQLYVSSLEEAGVSQQEMTFYLEAMASDTTALIPLLRDGGAEMRRLGDNARDLGGIMSDETQASLDGLRLSMANVGIAMTGIGNRISGVLAPSLTVLADGFANSMREGGALRTVIDALINNIDILSASVAVAVAGFGTRYVAALLLAKVGTIGLTGALAALRTALITTGIGALIVGAGAAVAMFGRLSAATGGASEAISLLKDVAAETWQRIGYGLQGLAFNSQARFLEIKADAVAALAGIVEGLPEIINRLIGAFVGARDAIVAAWGALPAALRAIGARAVNGLIEAIERGVSGVVAALNVIPGIDIAPPNLGAWRVEVEEATNVATAAADAFQGAFGADYTGAMGTGLRGIADEARAAAEVAGGFGGVFLDAARQGGESLGQLREAMAGVSDQSADAVAAADAFNGELEEMGGGAQGSGGGGGGGSAGAAADALEDAATFADGFSDALRKGVRSAADMGRELGGSLLRGIGSVSDAFGDFVVNGFRDFQGFVRSILDSFKQMLSQMISLALRNRIMIGLGFSGAGAGAAGAGGLLQGAGGGGGLLGGLLGSFGRGGSILGLGGLGGGTGFLGGLGNAVSGGLGNILNIGGNAAAAGGGILSTLGAAVPIIGAVGLAFAAFRTKTKVLDTGIQATVKNMDVLVQSFQTVEKSRFFGLFKKTSTGLDAASQETTDYVTQTVAGLQNGVIAAADSLGFAASTFDGFTHEMRVSTRGLSEEDARAAIEKGFLGLADGMAGLVPGIDGLIQAGEGASGALDRLSSRLVNVNEWMGILGLRTQDVSLAGGAAASAFVDMFGSLESFTGAAGAYYQAFYTDAERVARATDALSMQMRALGIDALPATRAAFRALVDEADALGNDGLVASLIQLAPAFAEIKAGADALNTSLRENTLFRTSADALFAETAGTYQRAVGDLADEETKDLLRDVLRAIREGNINSARLSDAQYRETRRQTMEGAL